MRMFASDRIASIMERLKWPDDEPITAKMVSRAVENAQRQIEELNFERRKNVLKYDDVDEHPAPGDLRRAPEGSSRARTSGTRRCEMVEQVVGGDRRRSTSPRRSSPRSGTSTCSCAALAEVYPTTITKDDLEERRTTPHELEAMFVEEALDRVRARRKPRSAPSVMRDLERMVLLNITDTKWREHLYEMDYLQEGIHLRAYGQKDPLTEYQREALRRCSRS